MNQTRLLGIMALASHVELMTLMSQTTGELMAHISQIREDFYKTRTDLIKWMFIFRVG